MEQKPDIKNLEKKVKQLKQQLQKQSKLLARYRSLYDDASVALYQTSPNGQILFANPALVKLLGYPDLKSLMSVNVHDLENTEDLEHMHSLLEEKELISGYETTAQKYDGTLIHIKDTCRAVRDAQGNILYYNGSLEDITEQKKTQEELLRRQKYLESVLHAAPDAIVTLDHSHRIIEWNPGAENIFGYTPEQAKGRNLDELISKENILHESQQFTEKILSGQSLMSMETIRYNNLGQAVHVIVSGAPIIISGKPRGVVAVYTDITQWKNMEKALQESEQRYRSFFARLPVGLFQSTPDGRYIDANPAFVQLLGYPDLDTLLNTPVPEVYVQPEHRSNWAEMVESSKGSYTVEANWKKRDGTPIWVKETAQAVRDEQGNVLYYEGVAEDITAIKKAEQEKRLLEQKLIQWQRMEAIGTLAGGIAHNFNNLLMGIQGNLALLQINLKEDDPLQKKIKNIEEMIKNGSQLTNQLLSYARKGQFKLINLNMNEIIQTTSSTLATTRKDISISLDLAKDLKLVEADQEQMKQMLLNILVNAAEAMPEGGELHISTRNVSHHYFQDREHDPEPGEYVLLSIEDHGIGMDEETKEHIFEPFFTTKGLAEGTGLGLASTYGIIKSHKGYIDVFSEQGKGTTFEIYLPISSSLQADPEEAAAMSSDQDRTILLVDDEEMIIDVGQHMLEELGYVVLTARSAHEALEIYAQEQSRIDLVILDMILPVTGGSEVFDKLKQINSRVKVLLSSGYSVNGQAKEILHKGCNGFIQKPYDLEELSQKINSILSC